MKHLPADTIIKYVYINEPEVIYEVVDNSREYVKEDPVFSNLHFKEDQYCNILSCYEPKKGTSVANDTLLWLSQVSL